MAKKRPDGRTTSGRFARGVSGNPAGRRKDVKDALSQRNRFDDWQNFFTGAGIFGKDKRLGAQFAPHTLSSDQLKDLWLYDDLASRAVDTIPKESMRQGYDLVISSAQDAAGGAGLDPVELASEVTRKLDVLGADEYLEVGGAYERAYGGAGILLGVNDGQTDMTQPLNLNAVKSLDWLTPLEARDLLPLYGYADPRAPKYGQPEIYQLTSRSVLPSYSGNVASATMQVHESRLIVFPGIRVSRYQTTTARGGWGESVLSRVYRVLRDFNTAWSSAGVLVSDFAQSVIKIAGLWEALGQDGSKAFQNRLAAMELGRSVVNAVTIDAADSYDRQQTPLTGLPDLLEKFAVRLAAACDMPLTLLFGTSPAGLNATGESDVRFFYDRVAAYQKRKMEPALRRICEIIFRTIGNRRVPAKWSVKFRPLWQESAKDKAAAMLTQAQADSAWITAGVLSPEEVSSAHWGKGEYDPNISVDFDAREAQEQAAAPPVGPEDEEAMLLPDDYVPPPGPGTAQPPKPITPPNPAKSAPDPNTRPVSIVQVEDAADVIADVGAGCDPREQVLEQLSADFKSESLDWVRAAYWEGPVQVPLAQIDYTKSTTWRAYGEPGKVEKFAKRIRGGWSKPIVLVKRPNEPNAASEPKLMIADGHHRALAYLSLGRAAMAYVAHVPSETGPWDDFHSSQNANASREDSAVPRTDAWSDEARAAALEARQAGAKSHTVTVSHGMKDPKGREVGGKATVSHDPKRGWGVNVQGERNGEKHGAYQRTVYHATPEEAHEAAIKGLQKQGDRYREKFGAGETKLVGAKAGAAGAAREAKQASGRAHALEHNTEAMKNPGQKARAVELHQKASAAHERAGNTEKAAEHRAAAEKHSGSEGKHGGEGKHGEKPSFGKKLAEFTKSAGEIVAGKQATKIAGQLVPGGHEGHEGNEGED